MAAPEVPDAAWTAGTAYPTTICRYGFVQTATHLYVFGGVSDGTQVNNVNRMDIASGTWQPRAPMPFTGEAPTCALMASTGIVYCAEGISGSGFASYNIATDTWTPLAAIPGGDHYGSASGAFNGRVFVAGGTSSITNAVQVYNVATNTWSTGTAAPSNFLFAGYQQVGQYLYAVGGFSSGGTSNIEGAPSSVLYRGRQPQAPSANITTTVRLDMSSAPGAWSSGPAFTQGRADFALASSGSKLVAIGGDSTGGGFFDSSTQVDEMDTTAWPGGAWVASPDNLPTARQANQAGFSSTGKIWSTGGLVGSTFDFLNENLFRATGCTPTVINGSIATSDPTQLDRLFRSGIPQTCPASTSCATFGDVTPRHYDSYTFTNTTGSPQCLMIDTNTACTGTNFIFIAAYLGSFDPNNICTNWIGDSGGSPNPDQPFSVNLAAGQTVVVVVSEVTPNAGCSGYTLTITGLCGGPPPIPSSAVSRKTHGGAGTFDINLPLVPIGGAVGIEDRTGTVAGAHTMVVTFANPVTVGGVAVTSGTGMASFSVAGAVVTVNLTGVTDAQRLGVTLMNVNDGTTAGDVLVPMGVLSGDTNASGGVSGADVAQTKTQSGLATNAGNFRTDVNSSGSITAVDVSLVKFKSGTVLPP
jgi:hypothetical protein